MSLTSSSPGGESPGSKLKESAEITRDTSSAPALKRKISDIVNYNSHIDKKGSTSEPR